MEIWREGILLAGDDPACPPLLFQYIAGGVL